VTASLSTRVHGLLALAGGALVAGLASGRPELVVAAVPMLLFVGVGLALYAEPGLTVEVALDQVRLIEGQVATATAMVRNNGTAAVDLEVALARTGHSPSSLPVPCCCAWEGAGRSG
jgi:uncharacterized protein (DUF58 family)